MDTQEIRALLGKSIFERAQKYRKRILQSSCTTNEDGVRHLTALAAGRTAIIRRSGCGKMAALSAPPATALIIRTATAPTASISVRCYYRTRKRTRLPRKKSPRASPGCSGALPG